MIKSFACLLFLLLGFSSLYASQKPEDYSSLVNEIEQRVDESGIYGLAYAIILPGQEPIIHTIGYRDSAQNTEISTKTQFRLGEISKTVSAIMLMRLIEQQKLSYDIPVSDYTKLDNPFETTSPLTFHHLLEQTSGLPSTLLNGFQNFDDTVEPSILFDNSKPALPIISPPGQNYISSDIDLSFASAIAEIKTKQSFDDLVKKLVFEPLAMNEAGFSNYQGTNFSNSYDANGGPAPHWKTNFRPSLSLHASIEDFTKLVRYLIKPEDQANLLSSENINALYKTDTALAAKAGFKLHPGKGLYPFMSSGHMFWGSEGQIEGFYASFGILPETGAAYALLSNTSNLPGSRLIRESLSRYLSQGLPLNNLPEAAIVNHHQYKGWWLPISHKPILSRWLWNVAGHIYLSAHSEGLKINQLLPGINLNNVVAINKNEYRPERSDVAVMHFFEHNNKQYVISNSLELYHKLNITDVLPHLLLAGIFIFAFGGALLVGIANLPLMLVGMLNHPTGLSCRALLFIASLSFLIIISVFIRYDIAGDFTIRFMLSEKNTLTVGLMVFSILWPLCSLLSLALVWLRYKRVHKATLTWVNVTAIGQLIIAVYLATHHWLPLVTWHY